MADHTCKSLTEHLAALRSDGLVDIKFYLHSIGLASPEQVCAEAEAFFDAIDTGAVADLHFTDSHRHAPANAPA